MSARLTISLPFELVHTEDGPTYVLDAPPAVREWLATVITAEDEEEIHDHAEAEADREWQDSEALHAEDESWAQHKDRRGW